MKLADFVRLKKFMNMTTSMNDHEAMGGLKAANHLLEREGLTWERVLDRSVKIVTGVEAAPEDYSEPARTPTKEPVRDAVAYDVRQIDNYIDIIERKANLKGDFEDTIISIIEQHRQGKRLSFKQRELLGRVAHQ